MIKKIACISLFVFGLVHADTVLDTKLKLLDMMQKDGIENIYTTYASLMQKKDKQKSKELLLKATDNQEYKAMRILGFKLFKDGEKEDALVLLCKVSILGDINVAQDLYMMPFLFDVTQNDINKNCKIASRELYSSNKERMKLNLFEKQRAGKALSYYEYFDFLTSKTENLTEDEYRKFLSDADKKNIPRVQKHKRLLREKLKNDKNKNWEYLRHTDRIKNRKKGISDIFDLSEEEDLKLIEKELKEKLSDFNALRAKNKTLTFDEFLNLTGKKQ